MAALAANETLTLSSGLLAPAAGEPGLEGLLTRAPAALDAGLEGAGSLGAAGDWPHAARLSARRTASPPLALTAATPTSSSPGRPAPESSVRTGSRRHASWDRPSASRACGCTAPGAGSLRHRPRDAQCRPARGSSRPV